MIICLSVAVWNPNVYRKEINIIVYDIVGNLRCDTLYAYWSFVRKFILT